MTTVEISDVVRLLHHLDIGQNITIGLLAGILVCLMTKK